MKENSTTREPLPPHRYPYQSRGRTDNRLTPTQPPSIPKYQTIGNQTLGIMNLQCEAPEMPSDPYRFRLSDATGTQAIIEGRMWPQTASDIIDELTRLSMLEHDSHHSQLLSIIIELVPHMKKYGIGRAKIQMVPTQEEVGEVTSRYKKDGRWALYLYDPEHQHTYIKIDVRKGSNMITLISEGQHRLMEKVLEKQGIVGESLTAQS